MAKVYVTQAAGSGGSVATGVLQLQNGVAMTTTLTAVTDQSNTASPLLLSTTGVQTLSKIQISTADTNYIDAEDNSGNNRFTVGRDPASQQVNVDFASNPGGSTELVGGFRTYVDGTNLSNVVNIRRDGQLQIGSTSASAMYWDNVNNRLGIGTATPATPLVVRANNSTTGVLSIVNANDSLNYGARVQLYDQQVGDPVIDGSNGLALIYTGSSSTSYVFNYNSGPMIFGTSASERMRITAAGNLGVGETAPTARVQIKGSGSTSATTSLLVQNSGGSTNLIVTDDQVIKGYAGTSLRFQFGGSSQAGISTRNGALCVGYIDSTFQNGLQISAEGSGKTFIDGWNDGGSLQYDIVVGRQGSRTQFGTDSASVSSAQVAINSTTRGFLPPRMTNAQRLAIATPAVGLMVYCTDAVEGLYVYKSTGWTFVI